jgi:hypothetical protein
LTLNLLTIRKKLLLKTFYISFLKPHCSSVWIHFHNHAEVDFIQIEFWRTSGPTNSFRVSDRKWKCNDSLFSFQFYFICQNFLENKTETPKITFFSLLKLQRIKNNFVVKLLKLILYFLVFFKQWFLDTCSLNHQHKVK